MEFKDILKKLRIEKGLTQNDLSKITGLTRSAIGMYELGKREPSFEVLELLADFFNVDMNTLLGKKDKRENNISKIDLKQRRLELGLTMKEIATAVGVSESTVSRWEAGNIANMKKNRLVALANILQIPVSNLIDDNSNNELPELTQKNNKDFPQIRAIQRAMTNVDEEKRNRMLEVLKISFQEAFEEDDDD